MTYNEELQQAIEIAKSNDKEQQIDYVEWICAGIQFMSMNQHDEDCKKRCQELEQIYFTYLKNK